MIPFLPLLSAAGGLVTKALRAVPWWAWLAAGALLAAFLYGETKEARGYDRANAEQAAQRVMEAAQLAEYKADQAQATVRTVTQYVDRVKVIHDKGETITKLVPVYVPVDLVLPGGFRVLHDAAAAGGVPDAAGGAAAEPVSAQAVAATVADNYTACHAELAKAVSLWEWASHNATVNPP